MSIITQITSTGVPIIGEDIDTDRIIPARFLKEITFENMGKYAFYDARFDAEGRPLDHPFNAPQFGRAAILIAGRNFGCGSSREHAPQALKRYGIEAIIAPAFAEIFRGNCKAIGIVTATVSDAAAATLQSDITANPGLSLVLDLAQQTLCVGNTTLSIEIPESHRQAFLSGTWDAIGLLAANMAAIRDKDRTLPYA